MKEVLISRVINLTHSPLISLLIFKIIATRLITVNCEDGRKSEYFHYAGPPTHNFLRRPIISGVDDLLYAYQTEFQVNRRQESSPEHGEGELEKPQVEHTEDHDIPEDPRTPYEIALESLTTPDKLLPIINNLTLIALVILHLPAIVPTILIPLAFFCVGALLIPIVRVNYFINHKDDGEDGRTF